MVDSLKVEVDLQGSEEVQRDFYAMGLAGREAFLGIATAAAALTAALAVAGAGIAALKLREFANAAGETEKALTQLQKVSGTSFQSLSALQQVFAAGGTPLKKFAEEFGNLSEKIASAREAAAKQDAIKANAEAVAKGFKATELGAITLEERVKDLLETLSGIRSGEQQWLKLADVFKRLKDAGKELEIMRLGKALGLSPESIATLTQGREAIIRMKAEAESLGLTLTKQNQTALQGMAAQWNQFSALLEAVFQKIGAAAAPTFASIFAIAKEALAGIVRDFENLPIQEAIANLGNRIAPAFNAIIELLQPILTQVWDMVKSLAATAGSAAGQAFVDGMVSAFQSIDVAGVLWNIIKNWFGSGPARQIGAFIGQQIIDGIKSGLGIGGGGAPAPSGAGSAPGLAGGGFIGGRGSGTSDSNLAWLSRGEYVTPARAVSQPGVLSFLEALRRSGGNLGRVLDGMGRFALGGMVPRAIPAFAAGGLAGGSNVTIQFPGLPPIGGLRASSDVVDQLHRAAALAQVRSGGRKPSRYT